MGTIIFFNRFGFFSFSFALALTSLSFATFPSLLIDAYPNFVPLLVSVSLGSTILALLLIDTFFWLCYSSMP